MSWKKKIALGFGALLAVIFLFLVVEHFRGKWGLARWKARMSAKGEPITIAAVTQPPPPVGENGMPPLLFAASQTYRFPGKLLPPKAAYAGPAGVIVITRLAEWPAGGRPVTNVTWKELGEALTQREDALKSSLEALQYPKFNAALDYYSGWSTRLPHLSTLRYLEWTLSAAALHRFRDGQVAEGVEFLSAAIRLAGTLEEEAIVISQLIRMRIAQDAFETTWQAAHAEGLDDAHLTRLQEAWAEQDFLRPMRRALSMEHVMISHEFERFRQADAGLDRWVDGGGSTPPPITVTSPTRLLVAMIEHTPEAFRNGVYTPIWKFAWSRQDELQCLKTVERALKAWDAATAQQSALPVRDFGGWDYRGIAGEPTDAHQNFYDGMRYIIAPRANGFYPAMKRAFCAQTLRELAITGLALQRYKLRFGKPAAKLEELVPNFLPKLPRDFMNGEVLKYAPPLLYSVGVDGEDNGGDVGTPATRGFSILEGRDFVWPREASPEEIRVRFESSP